MSDGKKRLEAITEVFQSGVEPTSYEQYLVQGAMDEALGCRGSGPLPADGGEPYHFTVGRDRGGHLVRYTADGDGFCQGLDTAWRTDGGDWFGRWRHATVPHGTFATTIGSLSSHHVQRIEDEARHLRLWEQKEA